MSLVCHYTRHFCLFICSFFVHTKLLQLVFRVNHSKCYKTFDKHCKHKLSVHNYYYFFWEAPEIIIRLNRVIQLRKCRSVITNCDLKKSNDCNTRKLKLVYSEFQFEQLITDYTRVATSVCSNGKTNTTRTVIDHLSTNRPNYISSSGVSKRSMSDHYMI